MAAMPLAIRGWAQAAHAPRWVYLGTDRGKGIYRARWNARTGEIGPLELAAVTDRPDYLALHPRLPVLYTVNSVAGEKAAISSYRLDKSSGTLTPINRISSHGDGPCFVSVDRTGHAAFTANYTGGSFAAYRIGHNGALSDAGDLQCKGNTACGPLGPVTGRQDAPHLHCTTVSPDNQFVLACDLGDDAIEVIPFNNNSKQLLGQAMRVAARPGSGPRHVAFHPNGRWVYCIHEVDCTVDLFGWHVTGGAAYLKHRAGSVVSTLANGVALAGNTACEILVSGDGRFVYTCTRGVDEILVYRVNPKTGLLTELQRLSCGGKTPRYIALDPAQRWLVSCNQGTGATPVGNLALFSRDPQTGRLNEPATITAAETPMFLAWV